MTKGARERPIGPQSLLPRDEVIQWHYCPTLRRSWSGLRWMSSLPRPHLRPVLAELRAKRLQLLKEALPKASRVAVLWNPATPFHKALLREVEAADARWASKPRRSRYRSLASSGVRSPR